MKNKPQCDKEERTQPDVIFDSLKHFVGDGKIRLYFQTSKRGCHRKSGSPFLFLLLAAGRGASAFYAALGSGSVGAGAAAFFSGMGQAKRTSCQHCAENGDLKEFFHFQNPYLGLGLLHACAQSTAE
ncbi:MAG TPA: hypothetical protein VF719_08535 [Abditibacteriaceae bacterium]